MLIQANPAGNLLSRARRGSHNFAFLPQFAKELRATPRQVRRPVVQQLIRENNQLMVTLWLKADDNLGNSFTRAERLVVWQLMLSQQDYGMFASLFNPTERKSNELLRAILEADSQCLESTRSEYLAPLMSRFTFARIPKAIKQHAVYANVIRSPLPQDLRSNIPDVLGRDVKVAGERLCNECEDLFFAAIESGQGVLVNRYFLFTTFDEWQAAVCLRNFISCNGKMFFSGIFYVPLGKATREEIAAEQNKEHISYPGLTWIPMRAWRPLNCDNKDINDLVEIVPYESY